jgi:hypothetical protein
MSLHRSPFFKTKMNTLMNKDTDYKKIDVTRDCSPEVLVETVNFMYGLDIKEEFDDFAGLLDAAERFMMDDFKTEIGKRMVKKVKLRKDNYMKVCSLADKYRVEVVADMCADYIHYKARSGEVDWEALKKLSVITASSMLMFKTKLEYMKGYSGCHSEKDHNCTCGGRASHKCKAVSAPGVQHQCTHSWGYCTHTCACCAKVVVMARNAGE